MMKLYKIAFSCFRFSQEFIGKLVDDIWHFKRFDIDRSTIKFEEFYGISLSISMNIPNVIIEGDSMVFYCIFSSRKTSSWKLRYRLDLVLQQLTSFQTFEIKHCFREVNTIADFLAKKATDDPSPLQDVDVNYLSHLL